MLETPVLLENSTASAIAAGGGAGGAASTDVVNLKNDGVGGAGFGAEERRRGEEGERNFGGNRWPWEETLALLKIRSDMDVAFRDSTPKAPLWDEVSRKLAVLGYHRSAKKCKEKFENIYKYHKRTKGGRSGRQNGKNYRFFDQLEAFDGQSSLPSPPPNKVQTSTIETTMAVPKTMTKPVVFSKPSSPIVSHQEITPPCSIQKDQNRNSEFMSSSTSTTSSSGKESEGNVKKKRKLADYFESLMKEVLERQENLQRRFIEAIEKCERDRLAREEAWKMEEITRMKKEQEILAQERAIAAAKDAAVIAFLQKISEQAIPLPLQENPSPQLAIPVQSQGNPAPPTAKFIHKQDNCIGDNSIQLSSSRWPKAEVEALINLRTNLDLQYQDNGPKGPLWEEISAAMKKLGYDRSAKRCKEKWENINKYYKRAKESNRKRPEDSKTCPYFHMLESLYEGKSRRVGNSVSSGGNLKPEDILMQMMGQQQHQQQQHEEVNESVRDDGASENVDQDQEDGGDADDDDNGDDYQIVANNPSSGTTME